MSMTIRGKLKMEREVKLKTLTDLHLKGLGEIVELHTEMQDYTKSLKSLLRLTFVSIWI